MLSTEKMNGFQVTIAIIKCVVGTGSFFLPQGIAQAGLWGGVVGLLLMAAVTMYLNYIILDAKFKYNADTYHELCYKVLGPVAGWAMFASVVITNVGSCSVYLVTGAGLLGNLSGALTLQGYLPLIAVFELFISWLPSFKYLSWTSFLGLGGLIVAMISVFVYGFQNDPIRPLSSYPSIIYDTYAVFFSTAAFLYIQPSTFFPIANAAAQPEKFNSYNTIAYVFIAIINTIFASIAYLFFGSATQDVVILNLCPTGTCDNAYTSLAHVALFIDVLFTFPLVLAPAHEVIESSLFIEAEETETLYSVSAVVNEKPSVPGGRGFQVNKRSFDSTKCYFLVEETLFRRNVLRTIVLLFTYGIAALIPDVSALLGIISGVTLTFNSFIMGPLIHLRWKYDIMGGQLPFISLFFHVFLILIGVVLGGWSTYLAVLSIPS